MARTYADRLPIVLTRPFNYTGVGQSESFVVPKLVSHFANRSASVELGNIDVVRDFSDVRAVAEAYVRLLDSGGPGGRDQHLLRNGSLSALDHRPVDASFPVTSWTCRSIPASFGRATSTD